MSITSLEPNKPLYSSENPWRPDRRTLTPAERAAYVEKDGQAAISECVERIKTAGSCMVGGSIFAKAVKKRAEIELPECTVRVVSIGTSFKVEALRLASVR